MPAEPLYRAFVGRSFSDDDKPLWQEVREILESFRPLGFEFEDAKEAQPKPVSQKVKEGIDRTQMYLGILTRRRPLYPEPKARTFSERVSEVFRPSPLPGPAQWTTSEWVIEEIGYALGKGRYTLLMVEGGVIFPPTDLDADTEWVPFDRDNLRDAQIKLTQIINRVIAEKLPAVLVAPSAISPQQASADAAPQAAPQKAEDEDELQQLLQLAKEGESERADALQAAIIVKVPAEHRIDDEVYLRTLRARAGEESSLKWLQEQVKGERPTQGVAASLARLYFKLGQTTEAISLLEAHLLKDGIADRYSCLLVLSRLYPKVEDYPKALNAIRQRLEMEGAEPPDPEEAVVSLMELAEIAKAASREQLAMSALERATKLRPFDTGLRFRVGFLYGQKSRHRMSAFHYRQAYQQDNTRVDAAHNLAIQYGQLKCLDLQVSTYKEILEQEPLAKANLGFLYIDAGFIADGEPLARSAMDSEDEQTVARANAALARITELREVSNKEAEELDQNTLDERVFRTEFALAFVDTIGQQPANVICPFPWGPLEISLHGSKLIGEGQVEREIEGLLGLAMNSGLRRGTEIRKFEADLDGLSGTFKYERLGTTVITSVTHSGLIVVDPDLRNISLLELRDEHPAKVYRLVTAAA